MKGLRLALGTLTIIPVGDLGDLRARDGRRAMLLAPVAALPLGLIVAALLWCSRWVHAPALLSGFVVVGALAYGTRAMHLDGLADTVDGLGAGWTRERAVAVMKSGDVGPMGVAALVIALGVQAAGFAALQHAPLVAGLAVVCSRCACTILASRPFRPARPDGLGAIMAGAVPPALAVTSLVLCGAALSGATVVCLGSWLSGALALLLATCGVVVCGRRATHVVGGISGDIFGAGIEISLTIVVAVLSCGGWT